MPQFGQDSAAQQTAFDARVDAETERRLDVGTDINLTGYGWVALRGRETDQAALARLKSIADSMIGLGQTTITVRFRGRDNVNHDLLPAQVQALFLEGGAYVQALFDARWALKDALDPSLDETDDVHWPSPTWAP